MCALYTNRMCVHEGLRGRGIVTSECAVNWLEDIYHARESSSLLNNKPIRTASAQFACFTFWGAERQARRAAFFFLWTVELNTHGGHRFAFPVSCSSTSRFKGRNVWGVHSKFRGQTNICGAKSNSDLLNRSSKTIHWHCGKVLGASPPTPDKPDSAELANLKKYTQNDCLYLLTPCKVVFPLNLAWVGNTGCCSWPEKSGFRWNNNNINNNNSRGALIANDLSPFVSTWTLRIISRPLPEDFRVRAGAYSIKRLEI